jgi:hypothetical protein
MAAAGNSLIDMPDPPDAYKLEARAGAQILEALRNEKISSGLSSRPLLNLCEASAQERFVLEEMICSSMQTAAVGFRWRTTP